MSVEAKAKLKGELYRVAGLARQPEVTMRHIEPEVAKELYYLQEVLIDKIIAEL